MVQRSCGFKTAYQRENRHVPSRPGPPKDEGAAESLGFLRAAGSNGCLVTEGLAGWGTRLTTASDDPLGSP